MKDIQPVKQQRFRRRIVRSIRFLSPGQRSNSAANRHRGIAFLQRILRLLGQQLRFTVQNLFPLLRQLDVLLTNPMILPKKQNRDAE